ncbi:putative membrane protein [Bradyrhizobium sp. USDA 4459]
MTKTLGILAAVAMFLTHTEGAFARGGSHGGRVSYGGGHHTSSHGGSFAGGSGSSHRGGTYVNSRTGNRYGTHQ